MKISVLLAAIICMFISVPSISGTITLKFVKSLNEDGKRSSYSKTEINQRQYELVIGTDRKYTNISVRAHSIIMAAAGKSKRIVGTATWDGELTSKKIFLITSVTATSTKDKCRGLYGTDLNSGWQVIDIIVEIVDNDKNKVIKIISGAKNSYKEFLDESGNLKVPEIELNEDIGYNDNTMSIIEKNLKKH